MKPADPFDPESLRYARPAGQPCDKPRTAPKLPRPKKGEPYIGGPIPLSWVSTAVRLPGKAWHVASALWFVGIRSRDKSPTVSLTLKTLRRFGLSRWAVYHGLRYLQAAGLVRVERPAGQRLVVTILPAPRPEQE
jgi:hypothetical protein